MRNFNFESATRAIETRADAGAFGNYSSAIRICQALQAQSIAQQMARALFYSAARKLYGLSSLEARA